MICLDASVATKWLIEEEFSEQADALAIESRASDEPMVGPPHLQAEVSNNIFQRVRGGVLTLGEGQDKLHDLASYGVSVREPPGLYLRAFELGTRYQVASGYDAIYLSLAWLLGAELWTDDRRLLNALRGRVAYVHWIGDWG